MRLLIGLFCVYFHCSEVFGQWAHDYKKLSTKPVNEREVTQRLRQQARLHWHMLKGHDNYDDIGQLYKIRTEHLIDQIESHRFIFSDTLQHSIDLVFNRILKTNAIANDPQEFFIGKNHEPNALCYGEGSFMITTGLLSRVQTEDQLAFIIAHELSHYQLNHIRDKTIQLVSNRGLKNVDREVRNILLGRSTLEGLEMLKAWNYQLSKFTRGQEQEADSLGLVMMSRAGYNPEASKEVIDILDLADQPIVTLGENLFDEFKVNKFPFQGHWIRPRLGIYHRDSKKSFIFDKDSLSTHPENQERISNLESLLVKGQSKQESKDLDSLSKIAQFESLDGAVIHNQLDYAMHLALQLKSQYPKNQYLVSAIAKIFILLYEARENRQFQYYVNPYTSHYGKELRLVNNFLYNIDKYEMMELAFYFMNKKGNFSVDSEEHFYLLWRISGITRRPKFQQKVKSSYTQKFPNGEFLTLMK